MKVLETISDALDRLCGFLIVLMLGAMVIVTTAQIICRTWFTSLTWADEVTRYLLIWSTYIGATCVYRHSGNISITLLQEALPKNAGKALRVIVHLICMVLFIVLMYFGFIYCAKQTRTATTLPIKLRYVTSVVPVSMIVMAFHALVMMLEELTGYKKEGK